MTYSTTKAEPQYMCGDCSWYDGVRHICRNMKSERMLMPRQGVAYASDPCCASYVNVSYTYRTSSTSDGSFFGTMTTVYGASTVLPPRAAEAVPYRLGGGAL